MDKERLRERIITTLVADYKLLRQAAESSHQAATHEENVPDSKYETLALEASYIAQGQANRAQQIKTAINSFRELTLHKFSADSSIRLTALVQLEDSAGNLKWIFLAPAAGGLCVEIDNRQIMLVTTDAPLGQELIGRQLDDSFELCAGKTIAYEIIDIE